MLIENKNIKRTTPPKHILHREKHSLLNKSIQKHIRIRDILKIITVNFEKLTKNRLGISSKILRFRKFSQNQVCVVCVTFPLSAFISLPYFKHNLVILLLPFCAATCNNVFP